MLDTIIHTPKEPSNKQISISKKVRFMHPPFFLFFTNDSLFFGFTLNFIKSSSQIL
jgi:hypothetical protein